MQMREMITAMVITFIMMFGRAGDSASFVLDNATSPSGESVILPWNAEWIGGNANATVVITDNGTEVKRAIGSGEFTLNISCGNHQLEYATFINGVKQVEIYAAEAELAHIEAETKSAKAATCTDDGLTHEVKCSRCNAVLEASATIPALGHVQVETKSAKAATCTEAGWTHEVKCSRCNAVLEASMTIPALGHVQVETKTACAATCTEAGWTHEVKCSRCNVVFEESTAIPAVGHVEVETKVTKAATCTEVGQTHEVKCSRCNAVLEASTTIPALGHVRQTTVAAIEPTCTTDGRTARVVCARCNATLEQTTAISALGHVRQTTVTAIEPTCTTDGRTAEVECSRCGVILETSEVIPNAGGHVGAITKPAVEPTSSMAGKTAEITCTRCGEVLQAQTTIPALGYIRNLTAAQLWPHRKIALRYELADDINEVATSATLPTVKGTYGSTTKTASAAKVLGDKSCTPGVHHIVWDVEGDSITHTQSSMNFSIAYSSVSTNTSCWVALSSSIKNGMSINGAKKNVWHSPFGNGEVQLLIDGNVFLSSTNLDVFAWVPQSTGSHTLVHKSGSYTWSRTLNVTSLVWDAPPQPNPPTAEDANIAIGTTSRAFGVNGGSGTITTSGGGAWTAMVSGDWITIPSSLTNRNAGLPVVYQVAANSGVEERTGYIYVSGHVFTVTQAGVGATLDGYSDDFEMEGGSGSFTVLADPQTAWKVRSNVDWISVTTDGGGAVVTQGTGEAPVYFTVAPWNEVSTRSGAITAAGCTFTVNQTGRRMKVMVDGAAVAGRPPYQVERDYQSHVIAITVNALASTEWDVEVDGSWLSVVDAGSGLGGGSVTIAVNENPSWLARVGKVRVGTEWLAINQAGRSSAALSFAISPTVSAASVKGANGLISVTATPDLPWTAASQANWLTVMPTFQSGAGNGNVVYTVSPNPTMANRSGTIQLAAEASASLPAKTHTVSQPAATAMISVDRHTFDAEGETFEVDVSTDDIVNWTISENIGWLSIVGSTSRIGPGRVALVATENLTVDSREASLTIAGHPFSVFQKGRTVEVEYESRVFGTESDYATIDVHPDGNVTWTAVSSDPTWITIWGDEGCDYDAYGNVIGTGDHTIEYIVADYVGDGTPRTGTITIGDKTVYITQRPYDLSINPSATTVGGNAGAGTVGVPASVGQVWNAIAAEPWITVVSGYDSGTGSGTVHFTYADNDTGAARTGRIIIAGEAYTITQEARQMVAISVTTRVVTGNGELGTGNGGIVTGAGVYDRGTNVVLNAVANDGYSFVNWTFGDGTTAGGAQLVVPADVDKELVANFRRIPVYSVNGEGVREGTSRTFTAPADVIDEGGTRKLVCRGTSRYPTLGTSFTLVVTEDIDFEWDLWTTNYLVTVEQPAGGTILSGGSPSSATAWIPVGSTIELTAVPDTNKSFFRWTGDVANELNAARSASAPYQASHIVMGPVTISAIFGVFSDTLATALDAPTLTFATGGDTNWLPVIDATAQTGYTSARSGAIGAEAETWLDTTVEGAGTLTFRWRVDCEKDDGGAAAWDRLAVFTNGVEAARIDGKTGWQTVELPIFVKTTIRWSFYRDDWDEPGQVRENAAWVDGVIFTERVGE